jgi:hypothetical protein
MRREISRIVYCRGVVVGRVSGGSDSSSEDDSEEEDEGEYGGIVPPFLITDMATNAIIGG